MKERKGIAMSQAKATDLAFFGLNTELDLVQSMLCILLVLKSFLGIFVGNIQ